MVFKSNKYQRNYIKWYSQRQMKLLKWFPNCLSLCSSKSLHRIRLDTWTIQHGIIFELEPDSWTNIVVIMKEIIDILNQAQQRDFKKNNAYPLICKTRVSSNGASSLADGGTTWSSSVNKKIIDKWTVVMKLIL